MAGNSVTLHRVLKAPPSRVYNPLFFYGGVGLGLSVARGFVEAMGGTISATDTPGGGLTVEIDLAAPPKDGSA